MMCVLKDIGLFLIGIFIGIKLHKVLYNYGRKKINYEHLQKDVCEQIDCGILYPPTMAQDVVHELKDYFLGSDWYDYSGATSVEQVNTAIMIEIEQQYRGVKIKTTKQQINQIQSTNN